MVVETTNPVVDSIAELRAMDTTDALSAKVTGYASEYDGGGGYFIRQDNDPPQSDDDGTIIVSTFDSAYYWRKWL